MNSAQLMIQRQHTIYKNDLVRKRNLTLKEIEFQRKTVKKDREDRHKQDIKDLKEWYDEQIQMSHENESETPDDATRAELRAFHMEYSADRRKIVRDRNDRKKSLEAGRKVDIAQIESDHKTLVVKTNNDFALEMNQLERSEAEQIAAAAAR